MIRLSQIPVPPRGVWRRNRKRVAVVALIGIPLVSGLVLIVVGRSSAHHAPEPPTAAAAGPLGPQPLASPASAASRIRPPAPGTTDGPGPVAPSLPPASQSLSLPVSAPVTLNIPAIHATSTLVDLGLNPDGTVQVPPLARDSRAGWYQYSAAPGAAGSSVILGHIDSAAYGPGIFYNLGQLRPGEEIDVTRADAITAIFRVDRVAEYPKTGFPTTLVYGTTPYASLKLVTCGGSFDAHAGSYLDNIIAFATLVGSRSA